MTALLRPRRLISIVMLTVAWCGLWQDISAANVIGGLIIAAGVTSGSLGPPSVGGVRPVPLVKLGALVLIDLIRSTVSVASEILTPCLLYTSDAADD